MTETTLNKLLNNLQIGKQKIPRQKVDLIETHISYLILLEHDVYKLKKTVQLPFVDFSELPTREEACRQELLLNRRLAPEVYRDVLAVKEVDGNLVIGAENGKTIDYAVWMLRIDNALEMDRLLEKREVKDSQIDVLACLIASFHQDAKPIQKVWVADQLKATFNQIKEWHSFAESALGHTYAALIVRSCQASDAFITKHIDELNQRSRRGFVKDLHGDLHSHNIFLTKPPVIFDCIEFDEDLRQIDVLNEIAFFVMDLEYYEAYELADLFISRYHTYLSGTDLEQAMDDRLLLYFKMYRAAVRAKVLMISVQNSPGEKESHLREVRRYLDLLEGYLGQLT